MYNIYINFRFLDEFCLCVVQYYDKHLVNDLKKKVQENSSPLRNFSNSDCILFLWLHIHMYWQLLLIYTFWDILLWENNPPYAILLLYPRNGKWEACWVRCSPFPCRVSLLKAVFCSFEQCAGELSLPVHLQGVKSKGQAEVAVTLYQHVCVHLCTFIASFHPSLFPELVSLLPAGLTRLPLCFLFIEILIYIQKKAIVTVYSFWMSFSQFAHFTL